MRNGLNQKRQARGSSPPADTAGKEPARSPRLPVASAAVGSNQGLLAVLHPDLAADQPRIAQLAGPDAVAPVAAAKLEEDGRARRRARVRGAAVLLALAGKAAGVGDRGRRSVDRLAGGETWDTGCVTPQPESAAQSTPTVRLK